MTIIKKQNVSNRMEIATIISIVSSAGMVSSLVLNWAQYRSGKKGTELNNYEKQLELITKLQEVKDMSYQRALKNKELEIESLKRDIEELKQHLQTNSDRINTLQNAVNRLIGDSCKITPCSRRQSYPAEEIMDVLGGTGKE